MQKGKRSTNYQTPRTLLFTVLFSAVFTVLVSFIFALAASASEDSTSRLGIYSLLALVVSGVGGGIFTSRLSGFKMAVLTALSIVLLMLICALIISGGRIPVGAFMNYGCYFGVFAIVGYLARKREGRRRRRRHGDLR